MRLLGCVLIGNVLTYGGRTSLGDYGDRMIIVGTPLVAVGIAALLGLSYWPMLLIGSGAGMVLSGLKGKFGMILIPHRMAGVVSTRKSCHNVGVSGEEVYDLSLAFVTPLATDYGIRRQE